MLQVANNNKITLDFINGISVILYKLASKQTDTVIPNNIIPSGTIWALNIYKSEYDPFLGKTTNTYYKFNGCYVMKDSTGKEVPAMDGFSNDGIIISSVEQMLWWLNQINEGKIIIDTTTLV